MFINFKINVLTVINEGEGKGNNHGAIYFINDLYDHQYHDLQFS